MINIVVFSKDRACQLDLFLRSFLKYYRGDIDENINVIFTYSDFRYRCGYEVVISQQYPVLYRDEGGRDFKALTESVIDPSNPYTCFFVDDNVFKEPFDLNCYQTSLLDSNPEVVCLSLRMHKGIDYCYTIPCNTPPPELGPDNTWDWRGLKGDWGYPMSLDGHIFRTKDILPLMKSLQYRSPNTLEGALAGNPINRHLMACLDKSPIFNNPCNRVQVDNGNHCGSVPADFLNLLYLNNRRISMTNLDGIMNNSAHAEVDIIVEERS